MGSGAKRIGVHLPGLQVQHCSIDRCLRPRNVITLSLLPTVNSPYAVWSVGRHRWILAGTNVITLDSQRAPAEAQRFWMVC